MMRLEQQYRILARAFPSSWRRRYGDDLVATLLDGSAMGQRAVSFSDAADVAARGLQTRLRDVGPIAQVLTFGIAAVLVTTSVNGSAATRSVTELAAVHPAAQTQIAEVGGAEIQIESVRSGTGYGQVDHDHADCSRLMFEQNT